MVFYLEEKLSQYASSWAFAIIKLDHILLMPVIGEELRVHLRKIPGFFLMVSSKSWIFIISHFDFVKDCYCSLSF